MQRYFYSIPMATMLTLAMLGTAAAQDTPQAQQANDFKGVVLKNRAPLSNEVLKVRFPKPVESKLANGMELMVLEDHRSPTIQVEVAIPGSSLNDPADLSGISGATAAMLRLGTRTRKAQQIAETLAETGASFGAGAGEHFFYLRFSTLSENLDAVLD